MAAGTTRPGATHGSSGHLDDGLFHVLVTARSPHGAPDGAGVVGHARSGDLVDWEVLPPLTEPGEFAQVEVPQLVRVQGGHTILFSCHAEDHSSQRVKRLGADGQGGTFALRAKHFSGPYVASDTPIAPFHAGLGVLYAGKLLEGHAGEWNFMAFCGDADPAFRRRSCGPTRRPTRCGWRARGNCRSIGGQYRWHQAALGPR